MSNSFIKIGLLFLTFFLLAASYGENDPVLTGLVNEALKNSPEIQASQARIEAAKLRIPQVKSLPEQIERARIPLGIERKHARHGPQGKVVRAEVSAGLAQRVLDFGRAQRRLKGRGNPRGEEFLAGVGLSRPAGISSMTAATAGRS